MATETNGRCEQLDVNSIDSAEHLTPIVSKIVLAACGDTK